MYSFVVVDDESIVREGIRDQIDWESHGFRFAGAYEDGRQAWAAIEQYGPDVVLTDINMPFVNGLELAERMMKRHPKSKVIILTGYDEFEYARRAVKLKVNDFVLKPVTASELRHLLTTVKIELDRERAAQENIQSLQIQLNESLPLLQEELLERMMSGAASEEVVIDKLQEYGIALQGPLYMMLAIEVDHYGSKSLEVDKELMRFAAFNIIQECVGDKGTVFRAADKKMVAILNGTREDSLVATVRAVARKVLEWIKRFLDLHVTIGIGQSGNRSRLKHVYQTALMALEYRFLLGIHRVIEMEEVEVHRKTLPYFTAEQEEALKQRLKTGTSAEIEVMITNQIEKWRRSLPTPEQCQLFVQRFMITILQAAEELGVSEQELFGDRHPFANIHHSKTLDEIEAWLKRLCCDTIALVSRAKHDLGRQQMVKAEHYLKKHYDNADIDLKSMCAVMHMSPSHFSLLFKRHTGKTFVEYVTELRIERAKELLKFTPLKTYEIAARIGYKEAQYFSVLFKRATGDSPTEFRRKHAIEPSEV